MNGESDTETSLPEVNVNEATVLYNLIQQRNYKDAADRAFTHPEETSTYVVTTTEEPQPDDSVVAIVAKGLPIHLAVRMEGPYDLIRALVASFPDGVERPDESGKLPLHLAFQHSAVPSVTHLLVRTYPDALHTRDREGRTPLDLVDPDAWEAMRDRNPLLPYAFDRIEELEGKLRKADESKDRLVRMNRGRQNLWENEKNFLNDQLSRSMTENDHILRTYKECREKHDAEIAKLKEKQKELKRECHEKKKRIEELMASISSLEDKMQNHERMLHEVDAQKTEIKQFQDIVQKTKIEMEAKDVEITTIKQELNDILSKNASLTRQLDGERDSSTRNSLKLNEEFSSKLEKMKKMKDTDISKLKSQVESMKQTILERDSEIKNLISQTQALQETISERDTDVNNIIFHNETMQDTITDLKSQVEIMNNTISEKEIDIDDLKRQVENMQNTIAQKEMDITELKSQVESMQNTIGERDSNITNLKLKLESMQSTILERDSNLSHLKSQLDKMQITISERDGDISNLKSQVETMQKTICEKETSMVHLKKEMRDVVVTVQSLTGVVNTLKKKNEKNAQKMKDIASERDYTLESLTEKESYISELDSMLKGCSTVWSSENIQNCDNDTAHLEKLMIEEDHPLQVLVQEKICRRDVLLKAMSSRVDDGKDNVRDVDADKDNSHKDDGDGTKGKDANGNDIVTMLRNTLNGMNFMTARLDLLSAVNSLSAEAIARRDLRTHEIESSFTKQRMLTREQAATIESLVQASSALDAKASGLEAQVKDRDLKLKALGTDMKNLSKKNSEFAVEVTNMKKRNVEKTIEMEKERDEIIATYEKKLASRKHDVDALKKELDLRDAERKRIMDKLMESENAVEASSRESEIVIKNLKGTIERMQEKENRDDQERVRVQNELNEKDDQINECLASIKSLRNQLEETEAKLKNQDRIHEAKQEEMSKMNELLHMQINHVKEECERLQRQVNRGKENSEKQRKMLAEERGKNVILEAKCAAADQNFDALKDEIEAIKRSWSMEQDDFSMGSFDEEIEDQKKIHIEM